MALGDTGTVPKRKTTWLTGRAKVIIFQRSTSENTFVVVPSSTLRFAKGLQQTV